MGRCLNVLEFINHHLLFPMASSMWYFPELLQLAMSCVQLFESHEKLTENFRLSNILSQEML
jgi:hypothetical protein